MKLVKLLLISMIVLAAAVVTNAQVAGQTMSEYLNGNIPINERSVHTSDKTIATSGNTDFYVFAPTTGTLQLVYFAGTDALAANNTNFITYTITNLGQAGAGSTVMLAATAANTTQVTGGTAIVANGKRTLTLSTTAANLAVVKGDRLRVRAAATGTLANTITFSLFLLEFRKTS